MYAIFNKRGEPKINIKLNGTDIESKKEATFLEVIIDNIHEILTKIKVQGNKTETLFLRGELSNYILEEDIVQLKKSMPN